MVFKPPTPSSHRLRLGLPGSLIPFTTLAFASERRVLFPSGITPQWTMIIHLGPRLLAASSDLPESLGGPPSTLSYLVLLQVGFAEPPMSPPELVSSYLTVSPLPRETNVPRGGLLSVALSFPSPGLGVTQHLALWSSDFPLPRPPKNGKHGTAII